MVTASLKLTTFAVALVLLIPALLAFAGAARCELALAVGPKIFSAGKGVAAAEPVLEVATGLRKLVRLEEGASGGFPLLILGSSGITG